MTVRRRAIGGGPMEVMKVKTKMAPLTGTCFYIFFAPMVFGFGGAACGVLWRAFGGHMEKNGRPMKPHGQHLKTMWTLWAASGDHVPHTKSIMW